MISIENAFNELGIDAVTGVEMMEWLGISPIDLGNPGRFSKFQSVIDYMKQFPVDTQRYLVKRSVNGKNVDKLSHVWEYTELLKNKKSIEDAMDSVKTESSAMGSNADPVIRMAHAHREIEIKDALNKVNSEITLYEK